MAGVKLATACKTQMDANEVVYFLTPLVAMYMTFAVFPPMTEGGVQTAAMTAVLVEGSARMEGWERCTSVRLEADGVVTFKAGLCMLDACLPLHRLCRICETLLSKTSGFAEAVALIWWGASRTRRMAWNAPFIENLVPCIEASKQTSYVFYRAALSFHLTSGHLFPTLEDALSSSLPFVCGSCRRAHVVCALLNPCASRPRMNTHGT